MTEIFEAKNPHYNARKPMMIIVHGTEVDDKTSREILYGQTIREVSSHYYIDDKGEVVQFLDPSVRAWHAGKGHWAGFSDMNSLSVGIELLAISNNGQFNEKDTFYTDVQIEALATLCNELTLAYNITPNHVLGHQDIDSGRFYESPPEEGSEKSLVLKPMQKRLDPGPLFPWKKLADLGVGAWHGLEEISQDKIIEDVNHIEKFKSNLTLYGYDTRPAPVGRLFPDVVTAFQTHFLPWNICGQVTEQSVHALDILIQKKFGL